MFAYYYIFGSRTVTTIWTFTIAFQIHLYLFKMQEVCKSMVFSLHLLSYKKKLTKILFHPRPWKDFLGPTLSQRNQVYLFFFEKLWFLTVTKISKCCHNDFLITKWSFNKVEDEPIKENMKKINIQIVWR